MGAPRGPLGICGIGHMPTPPPPPPPVYMYDPLWSDNWLDYKNMQVWLDHMWDASVATLCTKLWWIFFLLLWYWMSVADGFIFNFCNEFTGLLFQAIQCIKSCINFYLVCKCPHFKMWLSNLRYLICSNRRWSLFIWLIILYGDSEVLEINLLHVELHCMFFVFIRSLGGTDFCFVLLTDDDGAVIRRATNSENLWIWCHEEWHVKQWPNNDKVWRDWKPV